MRNIYHECGHVLFIHLFPEYFNQCEIITDTAILEQVGDEYWEAATKMRESNPGTSTSNQIDFRIKKIIIAFAGICSQNVLSVTLQEAKEKIPNWILSPDSNMDTYGVSGDFEIVKKIIGLVQLDTELEYSVIRKRVFELIFSVLTDQIIYEGLKKLAELAQRLSPETVTKIDIDQSFEESGIITFINANSDAFNISINEAFPYEKWDL